MHVGLRNYAPKSRTQVLKKFVLILKNVFFVPIDPLVRTL